MSALRKILVVLDTLDYHDACLMAADQLAALHHAELVLLHLPPAVGENREVLSRQPKKSGRTKDSHLEINKLCLLMEQLSHRGVRVVSRLCEGDFTSSILTVATNERADLIILRIDQFNPTLSFLGEHQRLELLERTSCPLLAVPEVVQPFRNSIFPIFQLEAAMAKYSYAKHLLFAPNMFVQLIAYPEESPSESRDALAILLSQIEERFVQDSIRYCSAACLTNDVASSLVSIASKDLVDLIVLTNSAGNGVRDNSFCDYAYRVISETSAAVLFVNARTILSQQTHDN